MDYRLLLMVVITLVLIGVMWYISSSSYTDRIKVNLGDTEPKLLSDWFKHELNINNTTDSAVVDTELIQQGQIAACSLLKVLHDVDIDVDSIFIGTDVQDNYHQITGKSFTLNRTLFNLRDILGLTMQICTVNPKLHDELNKEQISSNHQVSAQQLRLLIAIVDHKAYDVILPYIKKVLDHRWNKLLELQDDRIINSSGSYLYLRSDNEEILPNVVGSLISNDEVRINLLCSEYEFDVLLKRWRTYMRKHAITNSTSGDDNVL